MRLWEKLQVEHHVIGIDFRITDSNGAVSKSWQGMDITMNYYILYIISRLGPAIIKSVGISCRTRDRCHSIPPPTEDHCGRKYSEKHFALVEENLQCLHSLDLLSEIRVYERPSADYFGK